jgi:hypothetical protein
MIQRSTETVELKGDLTGKVLYHVTSVFDFVNGTLVNTGDATGEESGKVPVQQYRRAEGAFRGASEERAARGVLR